MYDYITQYVYVIKLHKHIKLYLYQSIHIHEIDTIDI